ncbi:MAG: major capsid protein [Pseudomonadota bacterium]
MATIGHRFLDLVDIYKGKDGYGHVAPIINMLAQTNGMLLDAVARPCNNGTKHKHTVLSGLPTVTWGKLYQGIPNSKAQRTQVEDTTGFVEGLSSVDVRLADVEQDLGAFRLQEAQAYLEAMSQEHQRALIYESQSSNPERITGLAPRFSSLSAENGSQIIDAGGIGSDNTSIWMVTWGMDACHMIYPKAGDSGIRRLDHGKQPTTDSNGNRYYAFEETFSLHTGITVRDWRKIVRIANIDVSAMLADPANIDGNGNDLYHFLRKGFYQLHGKRTLDTGTPNGGMDGNFAMGKTCIYTNKDVLEALDALNSNSGGGDNYIRLRPREVEGMEILTYRGMPLRQVDQILNTEARVT